VLQAQENACGRLTKKYRSAYDEALGYFQQGIRLRKNAPERAEKLFSEAYKLFKDLADRDVSYAPVYYYLGYINIVRQYSNVKQAEKYFLKAIELCPEDLPESYFHLSKLYLGQGKYDEALTYIRQFLKREDRSQTDTLLEEARRIDEYCKTVIALMQHPVPFEPKVVPNLSTPSDEYLFLISPDNEMAFFTRVYQEKEIKAWGSEIIEKEKFCVSYRNKNSLLKWTEPDFEVGEPLPEPFNQSENEGGATITLDNNLLVFTICKFDKTTSRSNCDLYEVRRKGGFWEDFRPLEEVNTPDYWESQPSITADGHALFFVSDRPGGVGGYDIYVTYRKPDGTWGKPQNLGRNINTPANEKSPFIHSDSQTLYFSSQGWPGLGGYDIFYSRLQQDGSWTKPKNIGYPINTTGDDAGFFVSFDGKYGFFVSKDKKGGVGGWDLYYFPLYEEIRPQKIALLKGEIKKDSIETEFSRTTIEIRNLKTKEVRQIPIDLETGKYAAVLPLNNKFVVTVKEPNHVSQSFLVSTDDTITATKVDIHAELKPIEVGSHYTIHNIYFKYNSYELTDESKDVLDEFVVFLNENPTLKIEIQGHTDNIGTAEFNLKLSEKRARSVYEYLISKGIASSRLLYRGFGFSNPIADNNTEEGRAKNRRTEFLILEK